MSRSRKKQGGYYITLHANRPHVRKKEKQHYNSRWRQKNRIIREIMPNKHEEIVDLWALLQDGRYIKSEDELLKRK